MFIDVITKLGAGMTVKLGSLNSVDLRLLRVFKTVVESGGFSAGQVELNVSQSTISTQMADLETRLGARLCRRGRAGFNLTDNGRMVYEASQRLFRAVDAFSADVGAMRGRLEGDLHIGAIDNMISNPDCRLQDAIARFKQREAAVHLYLHIAPPLEVERSVLDGHHHIGLGTFPSHAPGLAYSPLFSEEMRLYCGRGHPFFDREGRIGLAEIEQCEYVRRGYATTTRIGRFSPTNVTATAFNMEAVAIMVLSGRFIGHMPIHYAVRWVRRGLMKPVMPDELGFASPFEVIVRKGTPRSSAIEVFLDDLAAASASHPRAASVSV